MRKFWVILIKGKIATVRCIGELPDQSLVKCRNHAVMTAAGVQNVSVLVHDL